MSAHGATRSTRIFPGRANAYVWILVLAVAVTVLVTGSTLTTAIYRIPVAISLLLALAQSAALGVALLYPRTATALATAAAIATLLCTAPTPFAPWPMSVVTIVALSLTWLLVGFRSPWYVPLVGWAATTTTAMLVSLRASPEVGDGSLAANLTVLTTVTLALVGIGIVVRRWDDVRGQLQAARAVSVAESARREAMEEKARIARELHDVVAHGMSAIQVRASSARYRISGLMPEAATEFDEIAGTARAAMAEMRVILGLLRDEVATVDRAPQPGLCDIDELVRRARDLGDVRVDGAWTLTSDEENDPLLGLTTYRVVQEALSNVARHAAGAPATITWSDTPSTLTVSVANVRPAQPVRAAASLSTEHGGQGLRGMRERVHLLGGDVLAQPVDGGFRVRASIPRNHVRPPMIESKTP